VSSNKTTVPAMATKADVTKAVSQMMRALEYWFEHMGDLKSDDSARIALHSAANAIRAARVQFEAEQL